MRPHFLYWLVSSNNLLAALLKYCIFLDCLGKVKSGYNLLLEEYREGTATAITDVTTPTRTRNIKCPTCQQTHPSNQPVPTPSSLSDSEYHSELYKHQEGMQPMPLHFPQEHL